MHRFLRGLSYIWWAWERRVRGSSLLLFCLHLSFLFSISFFVFLRTKIVLPGMEAHEGGYGTEDVRLQKNQMPLLLNEYGKHGFLRKKNVECTE